MFSTCGEIIVFLQKVFFRHKVISEYIFHPISETEKPRKKNYYKLVSSMQYAMKNYYFPLSVRLGF